MSSSLLLLLVAVFFYYTGSVAATTTAKSAVRHKNNEQPQQQQQQQKRYNHLGDTPQMGWNTWNAYACDIDADLILKIASYMASNGFLEAGYTYVNVDDCWQAPNRSSDGIVYADHTKFPKGMQAVVQQVNEQGFKFGIYSDAGYETCQHYPGSLYWEERDAQTYVDWGVSYLKYDNCNTNDSIPIQQRYQAMSDALLSQAASNNNHNNNNDKKDEIFFSICEWGREDVATWAPKMSNSWRTTGDIEPTWSSIMRNADQNNEVADVAGPGHWNDPDMLECFNGNLTFDESVAHFVIWCVMKAPLLLGQRLNLTSVEIAVLTNPRLIGINQDALGIQGTRLWSSKSQEWYDKRLNSYRQAKRSKHLWNIIRREEEMYSRNTKTKHIEIWGGPLSSNSTVNPGTGDCGVFALLNREGKEVAEITVEFSSIPGLANCYTKIVTEGFTGQVLGRFTTATFTAKVNPHAVEVIVCGCVDE